MRLIGLLDTEQEAASFHSFLLQKGIQSFYEIDDPCSEKSPYRLWVYKEEDFDSASSLFLQFTQNPNDALFQQRIRPKIEEPIDISIIQCKKTPRKWQGLTPFLVLICSFLFIWNSFQENQIYKNKGALALQVSLTPLMRNLLFDYPKAFDQLDQFIQTNPLNTFKDINELPVQAQEEFKKIEAIPYWKGILDLLPFVYKEGFQSIQEIPKFEKIKQGQVWRLITPIFIHRDFLHILFNMVWLCLFCKQLDLKIGRAKTLCLIVLIGIASNVAQYLMSGPYFVGISGVVVGMGGFVWMRQRKAPWEGYSVQKSALLLLFLFVGAMVALDGVILGLRLFFTGLPALQIANTAHVVGGITGIFLGSLPWFKKGLT